MSLHNKPEHNTPPIVEALKEHGLKHGSPSQLADAFRLGYRAALAAKPRAWEPKLVGYMDKAVPWLRSQDEAEMSVGFRRTRAPGDIAVYIDARSEQANGFGPKLAPQVSGFTQPPAGEQAEASRCEDCGDAIPKRKCYCREGCYHETLATQPTFSNAGELTDAELLQFIPTVLNDKRKPVPMVWLKQADAFKAIRAALASKPPAWEQKPDDDKVICPGCCHQFRAIPVNVQRIMLDAGFEPPFTDALPLEHGRDYEAHQANGLAWAVSRWKDEVANRPLINTHRRTLDDSWRQVIRYFGGNPDTLVGPSHDDLLAAARARGEGQS